jgi:hypothetical protein
MVYHLKDQNVAPPPPDPLLQRSMRNDGLAAVAMMALTAGLIALIIAIQIIF